MKTGIERMIEDIKREALYTRSYTGKSAFTPEVMDAMANVPREEFVPDSSRAYAFDNGPLPIGHGQTISQPYIVALMTDLLQLQKKHTVLEIGTGSGYQTAILSLLCNKVYTMELIDLLQQQAMQRLTRLGYSNIETCSGNGYKGWPEHAPYDAIIVTAAATHIPDALIEQLKPGGRLVIPVGEPYFHQDLILLEKNLENKISTRTILGVAFVPLRDIDKESAND